MFLIYKMQVKIKMILFIKLTFSYFNFVKNHIFFYEYLILINFFLNFFFDL